MSDDKDLLILAAKTAVIVNTACIDTVLTADLINIHLEAMKIQDMLI